MWEEHLKSCIAEDRKADMDTNIETPETYNWRKVVYPFQTAFRDRKLLEEETWKTLVLIPEGGRKFQVTGVVDVLWNTV